MSLLVPVGLLQLHVLPPQTHFHDGHLTGGHAAYSPGNPLQFAASPAYTTSGGAVYPASVYSTGYHHHHHSSPPFQPDYRSSITYNTAGLNEIVRPVVYTGPDPTADVGRYTQPRVFFDDDHSEDSRVRRLEEDLREERLRQNLHQHTSGAVPVRENRRYEKSVEGDLDFSEDKKLKLARRRKRDTTADAAGSSSQTPAPTQSEDQNNDKSSEDSAGIEERRLYPGRFQPHYAPNGGTSSQTQQRPSQQGGGGRPQQQRPQQQRPNRQFNFQNNQRPQGGGQRGQRQPPAGGPNSVLRGQPGFYGAFRGTFGGQGRNQKATG